MTIYKKLADQPNVENMAECEVEAFVADELNKVQAEFPVRTDVLNTDIESSVANLSKGVPKS